MNASACQVCGCPWGRYPIRVGCEHEHLQTLSACRCCVHHLRENDEVLCQPCLEAPEPYTHPCRLSLLEELAHD
ncbi:hypothetical protein [Bailinhaonella thermotolerans]|uniref:Uncharacterized protein n=1 Tax=Bailinhaonella thermotolerans TaxID=1070861 RepID=A0A3A4AJL3_9ACTN|nr:hypothetical protein [Bailinhaonella thermotolerans]RJL21061.1 hypothetical protein D5H75_38250 [Bailinhaonella thermotolerans]